MEKPLTAVSEEYSFFCARVILRGRGCGGSGILDGSGVLGAWLSTLMMWFSANVEGASSHIFEPLGELFMRAVNFARALLCNACWRGCVGKPTLAAAGEAAIRPGRFMRAAHSGPSLPMRSASLGSMQEEIGARKQKGFEPSS